ncbi:paraquat-inducible protein A [Desulfomicrobium salsuginis]
MMNTAIDPSRRHETEQTPASDPRRGSSAPGVVACQTCDLLTRPSGAVGTTSLCPRCGAVVHRQKSNSIDRPLAFALSGLILFAIALTHPFLAMKSGGFVQETTLLTGIFELWKQHLYGLGALVLLTCALIPLAQLTGLLYILVPLRLNAAAPGSVAIFRAILHVNSWAMMEVFVIGILVALVKLAKMATIVPGAAVMALGLLTVVTTAAMATLDPPLVWARLDRRP